MERDREELVEWLVREGGATRFKAQRELDGSLAEVRHAVSLLDQPAGVLLAPTDAAETSVARRVPVGVVAAITPWNAPMLLAMRVLAPALALGNTVMLKPDLQTPVSGGLAIAALFEEVGLPSDVLHVLPGDAVAGEALVKEPLVSLISFTGSSATGCRVATLAATGLKRVSLELGGNNPLVVLEDADVAAAAEAGAWGSFYHQGQICLATGRHLVHERVVDTYVDELARRANALVLGDPWRQPEVDLGPIVSQRQLHRVHRIVTDTIGAGARLRAGGTHNGLFYRPTVLDKVAADMPAFGEEIFGPVAAVTAFSSTADAIELANRTDYRLSASVHTADPVVGMEVLDALDFGMVHLNNTTVRDASHVPFGGMGRAGNGTRFGGPASWEEFTMWQWRTTRVVHPPAPSDQRVGSGVAPGAGFRYR